MDRPLLSTQPELRVILPTVQGNVDYQDLRQQLHRINELLILSRLEERFVAASLRNQLAPSKKALEVTAVKQQRKCQHIPAERCVRRRRDSFSPSQREKAGMRGFLNCIVAPARDLTFINFSTVSFL